MAPLEAASLLSEEELAAATASGPPGPPAEGHVHALRSKSVPDGASSAGHALSAVLKRSNSFQAVPSQGSLFTKEILALVQELAYHTDLSQKQLQELGRRMQAARGPAQEATPKTTTDAPAGKLSLVDVLAEFDLPADPELLRNVLAKEWRRRPRLAWSPSADLPSSTPSSPSDGVCPGGQRSHRDLGARGRDGADAAGRIAEESHGSRSGEVEDRLRMAVRCQMSCFMKEPRNRVKVIMLWRHEAGSLQAVQSSGSVLGGQSGEKWYERLYVASEAMLSNLLDENDSPLREVVFDLVSHEAKRAIGGTPKAERGARPAPVDAMRRVFGCFADAVLAVRARPSPANPGDCPERSQWADCLSRLGAQFERALEGTWRRLWPGSSRELDAYDEDGSALAPPAVLRKALLQSSENCLLLRQAAAAAVGSAELLERAPGGDPESLRVAYVRQAIRVSKGLLKLAREMSVLAGLWMSGRGSEGEELSLAVHRQEYRRVRRAFAELLLKESAPILAAWSARVAQEAPAFGAFLVAHRDRHLGRKLLSAVIEWWRTGHSGKLRTACMDLVALRFDEGGGGAAGAGAAEAGAAAPGIRLEEVQAVLPLLEEVVLETLRRELAVRQEQELSAADEPRVRDILARLTHELGRHIEGEWHIAETARGSAHDALPQPALFQPPQWRPGAAFDVGAAKTAFLGAEIGGRYVVTRYVSRGAMGRVWVVEDRLHPAEFPLCLKTFYCERECEEMDSLPPPEFRRCVLEELSQVERWLTSHTRLASARHLVQVVRVFREAPVVRTGGGARVEGALNGILMEFCDRGELTSYLWDEVAGRPRAFDEWSAQFLFAQLMELLVELFEPQLSAAQQDRGLACEREAGGGHPELLAVARNTSTGGLSMLSFGSVNSAEPGDGMERQSPTQYFHNDIKTENLVFSGTTLKLIDFQSLTPLRHSRSSWHTQLEHATVEYQHRHPGALGESMSAHAEGVALWACGVILTRLLAAELTSDWVHRYRGLGPQQALEQVLPPDHCLLQENELGPRDLLDSIFSAEATPSIVEVLDHPWVISARGNLQAGRASAAVEAALDELRPQGCDPRKDLVAWIPLPGCLIVEGRPPPVQEVEEMLRIAIDVSGGHFRQEGQRRRSRRASVVEEGEAAESFHEWHIILCDSTAEDGDAAFVDTPSGAAPALVTGSPSAGSPPTSPTASPTSRTSPGTAASRCMWQRLRTRLVLDRFCLHLRHKDALREDEPRGVWWLRLKWLPAMVAGKRAALGGLTLGRRRLDGGLGLAECGDFVRLQQLLLEGRNELEQRQERAARARRRPAPVGGLMLPIMGR